MPEPGYFLRYRIAYGTLQHCLGCQRAALLRGISRRENPTYTYWRHAARASRDVKMVLFTEPSEDLCWRQMRSTECPIVKYFSKSLKVTQGHSKWHPWVGFDKSLLVFHCNYVCISYLDLLDLFMPLLARVVERRPPTSCLQTWLHANLQTQTTEKHHLTSVVSNSWPV